MARRYQLSDRRLPTIDLAAVLADNPERAAEHLARLDVANRLEQALGDGVPELRELLDNLTHERDDVDRRRVAGVADELHQNVDDRSRDLGEFDRTRVD
jgi:hypothetical protein